jgi:hypothetical protein
LKCVYRFSAASSVKYYILSICDGSIDDAFAVLEVLLARGRPPVCASMD